MEPCILVKIPDKCFLSPDPKRTYSNVFYFSVTYGYLPSKSLFPVAEAEKSVQKAIKYPQITISGFEKLLSSDRMEAFIDNLKRTGSEEWVMKKSSGNDIILRYTGEDLETDFYFSAETDQFVPDIKENDTVTLQIKVEYFPEIPDHSYIISTKVDYTPWAKSLRFSKDRVPLGSQTEVYYEIMGDNIDKRLTQDGIIVDTARSPYTATINQPSVFTLEVFNQSGMNDRLQAAIDVNPPKIVEFHADRKYFSPGTSAVLTWSLQSVSSFQLENLDPEKDVIKDNSAVVYPKVNPGARAAVYTLRAYGFINKKPNSTTANVVLTKTNWSCEGTASGYFAGDIYGNIIYNSRIFTWQKNYYCYAHPKLYQSTDGISWTLYHTNDKADDIFLCIATGFQNNILYAMGRLGDQGSSLYISTFDFTAQKWTYAPAYQNCLSSIGSFAFSQGSKAYAATIPGGMMMVQCDEEGKWNSGTYIIPVLADTKAICGDYCFFKDRYYAVMLCDNHCIYVYDCEDSVEEVLFQKYVGMNDQYVSFISTLNNLYIMTDTTITDLRTQAFADDFCPPESKEAKRAWLGVNKNGDLFGIFPDKKQWIFTD
jgi:hypothetical protein